MKKVVIWLIVALCLMMVLGCSQLTGDVGENQPIYLFDPEITIDYSGGDTSGQMSFPVTVDTNLHSLYPGLLEEVDLVFDYELEASIWRQSPSFANIDWRINGADWGAEHIVVDTDNASLTAIVHPDSGTLATGDQILITVYATVRVSYDRVEPEDDGGEVTYSSVQTYQLHSQYPLFTVP